VNLILFETAETNSPLPRHDSRAAHIVDVLRRKVGDTVDTGLVGGPRGKATVTAITAETVGLSFAWEKQAPPPLAPITLIVGLPRPQTVRKLLHSATELGVAAVHFVATEKSEPSYAQSKLWSSGEWRRHLLDAAQQAFDTHLPDISHGRTLTDALASLEKNPLRLALDNYESPASLSEFPLVPATPVALALGPERGWSARDREALRAHGFAFAHLGPRVLRTETAVIAALTLIRAKLGLL
jgi:RsmE family RNA methyltransferase